jgi:hypothetical protein
VDDKELDDIIASIRNITQSDDPIKRLVGTSPKPVKRVMRIPQLGLSDKEDRRQAPIRWWPLEKPMRRLHNDPVQTPKSTGPIIDPGKRVVQESKETARHLALKPKFSIPGKLDINTGLDTRQEKGWNSLYRIMAPISPSDPEVRGEISPRYNIQYRHGPGPKWSVVPKGWPNKLDMEKNYTEAFWADNQPGVLPELTPTKEFKRIIFDRMPSEETIMKAITW